MTEGSIERPAPALGGTSALLATIEATPWLPLLPLFGALVFLVIYDPIFLRVQSDDPLSLPLQGNMLRRLVLGGLYAVAGVTLFASEDRARRIIDKQTAILALATFAVASILWSSSPSVTLTRSVHFVGLLLTSWAALLVDDAAEKITSFLRLLLLTAMLLSILWVIGNPLIAVNDQGAWAGIFRHKSELGGIAVLSLATWMPMLRRRGSFWQLGALAVTPLAFFLVWQSKSVTEMIGAGALVGALIVLRLPVPWRIKLPLAPIPVLLLLLWFWNFQGSSVDGFLQGSFDRDTSLTGRTPLWDAIIDNIWLHPLLGEGYNGFWVAGNPRAEYLIYSIGWDAYHAHNGYLEVVNALGFVGFAIFAAVVFQGLWFAGIAQTRQVGAGTCVFLIFLWLLISGITKSVFCQGTTVGWIHFLVAYATAGAIATQSQQALDNSRTD